MVGLDSLTFRILFTRFSEEPAGFDPNHISLTVAPSESVSAPPAKRKKVERAAKPPAAPRTVKPRVTK